MARTAHQPKSKQPSIVPTIKDAARGRWAEILATVGGFDADSLDGSHHPCPKCGGRDRFRFSDQDGDGSIICNQCARRTCGDGLASIGWLTGWTFPEVVRRVAQHLGIGVNAASPGASGNGKPQVDPAKDLQFLPWSDAVAAIFCQAKRPITPAAIVAAGGRLARYRKQYTVIALPVVGPDFGSAPVGWVLYNATGGTLPKWSKDGKTSQVKVKLTHGSRPGLIGTLDRLAESTTAVKVEGPSDLLAMLSLPDLPPGTAAITNAMGAGEIPQTWMVQRLAEKTVYVVGDADQPGQKGAEAWAAAAAAIAGEVRIPKLPYDVTETHGKDLRDWISAGYSWADLQQLAGDAKPLSRDSAVPLPESIDDPHRLARLNLERYATSTEGRTLRFWRSEWYVWKRNRYRRISEDDLRAKLSTSIKAEFDRAYRDGEVDEVRRVTGGIVSNVLGATASLTIMSPEIEFGTWIEDRRRRAYVSMTNGILDLDAVMSGKDESECLIQHSPNWFSLVALPYQFDSNAGSEPATWLKYLDRVMEGDQERIAILQEWAGYLLLPDTGHQRFVVLEGDGANGKSVYCAAMTAMLGGDNVSNIQLEVFGDRFSRTETLGKLCNVCGDVGEIDKVSEGYVKSFTSGDRMYFDRKGISGLNVVPTARLTLACNTRPRFSDRSDGIWRRMLLVPFRVQIPEEERVIGMDKIDWWEQSGELPAILNWAILGLARLRQQGRFTRSRLVEQTREEYREEMNPARMFLKQFLEESRSGETPTRLVYQFYAGWIRENGYKPLSERQFGKEVHRVFRTSLRRIGTRDNRSYCYEGIQFTTDEICGVKIQEKNLPGF
jgi:P4 family phage/plasmid primase-like protien